MRDPEDEKLDRLISSGAIEPAGINPETGEVLYNFTPELARIDPELDAKLKEHFHREMLALWEKGFIDMDVTIRNPAITLAQKAFDSNQVKTLTKDQQFNLKEIFRVLEQNN